MDMEKDQPCVKLHQTPARPKKTQAPAVIGTWSLRNREQLRKRKAEVQEQQTSQWLLGEQKKCKRLRRVEGKRKGRKRQNAEPIEEPPSPTEKEAVEKVPAPAETGTRQSMTGALPLSAHPPQAVPEEQCSEIHESNKSQDNPCEHLEAAVRNHSETRQWTAEPKDLSAKTCQETAEVQEHPLKMGQYVAESEDLSPAMCQPPASVQEHLLEIRQDGAEPEVLSPKMYQETVVPQDDASKVCRDMPEGKVPPPETCQETAVLEACPLPCATPEDRADPEGSSPKEHPISDVPAGSLPDPCPKSAGSEEFTSEPDQGITVTEGLFPQTQEITTSKNIPANIHPEAVESEYFPPKTLEETTVTEVSSYKTIQEIPGSEDCSSQDTLGPQNFTPEIDQETPGHEEYSPEIYQDRPEAENYSPETYQEIPSPEDLSVKTYKDSDVLEDCFPEPVQEADGPQGQDPSAHQGDVTDADTFSPEMKEEDKDKGEDPEIPCVSQEICPENDIYNYVLF